MLRTRSKSAFYTGRPGVLIGKAGAEIEVIKKDLAKLTKGKAIIINVRKVEKIDQDAQLVAEAVASQLEKRVSYRRAVKQQIQKSFQDGASRALKSPSAADLTEEKSRAAKAITTVPFPLQTIRADIDYGFAEAHTTFGVLGIKCWVYKGEVLTGSKKLIISDGGEE